MTQNLYYSVGIVRIFIVRVMACFMCLMVTFVWLVQTVHADAVANAFRVCEGFKNSPDSHWVGSGRVALRYVSPSPPLDTVRETFASYGSREKDIMGKVHFANSTERSPWSACAFAGYLCTISRPSP